MAYDPTHETQDADDDFLRPRIEQLLPRGGEDDDDDEDGYDPDVIPETQGEYEPSSVDVVNLLGLPRGHLDDFEMVSIGATLY